MTGLGVKSSGRRLHQSNSISNMDTPTLLVHRSVMPPAQGDQVLELGWTAVRPVDDVMTVNPQMYSASETVGGE
jgi:hypothetical protein